MKNEPVAAQHWKSFTDTFSRSHDGWVGSLEVREPGLPARVEVDESPFRGATIEKHDGRETLILTFGYEPEEHFAHIVHEPRAVVTSEGDDGSEASVVIDATDGSRCILAVWNPLREGEFMGA
jgi:hypothetical protein